MFLSTVSLALLGQVKPSWTSSAMREVEFPSAAYFSGYTQGNARSGETLEDARQRLLREAQGLLIESIRVTVRSRTESQTVSTRTNRSERIDAVFATKVETDTEVEIAGMNFDTPFVDPQTNVIHAFAWVNRVELSAYHIANMQMNITQAEGLLQTARDLEQNGEKIQARRQCEAAAQLIIKVRQSQDLLTAIDSSISAEGLQLARTEALQNQLLQTYARLAQAMIMHIESVENNFSRSTTLLTNRLRALLVEKDFSFADNTAQADFLLKIEANTRQHGVEHGLTVCYADVVINLFDVRRNRSVFQDEFSQKGISTTSEAAGRRALEDAAPTIISKISQWIE